MSEIVTKLWEQAAQRDDLWDQARHEKFAELIVNECCKQLLNEDIRYSGYGYNQYGLHSKLREHFGVKE